MRAACAFFGGIVVMGAAAPSAAQPAAPSKKECAAAYEDTQALRRDGRLAEAQKRALACTQDACPDVVKQDCTRWLAEIETNQPTVVFEAFDTRGAETASVEVSVDGAKLLERLDGKAVAVDPGERVFRYQLVDGSSAPVETRVVVREGEKNRKLTVRFAGAGGAAVGSEYQGGEGEGDAGSGGGVPTLAWVLGGVGVVGIGAFATLGVLALNEKANREAPVAEGGCAPNCSDDQVSSVRSKLVLADVSLGVGVAALGVATYLFIASRKDAPAASQSALRVQGGAVPGGGWAALGGAF
jgi:hypothetical protein